MNSNKKDLSSNQRDELLRVLKARFEKNLNRHKGLEWAKVQAKLEANGEKLWSLGEMERTGQNFAQTARFEFGNRSPEQKKDIFADLGSNLTLNFGKTRSVERDSIAV